VSYRSDIVAVTMTLGVSHTFSFKEASPEKMAVLFSSDTNFNSLMRVPEQINFESRVPYPKNSD
jgi:hypothetical protein